MILSPTGISKTFVKLASRNHIYSGPTELTQYFVRSSTMRLVSNLTVEVEVVLGRRLIGTFMTIYMPTILLNIIGHSTNYFKPFFFEAVVTVNLTVMLVLTTMFVGVSQGLPKTSSIKMVDYWLVFNLLIPFVEVLIHTYEDTLRTDDTEVNHHGRSVTVGENNKEESFE